MQKALCNNKQRHPWLLFVAWRIYHDILDVIRAVRGRLTVRGVGIVALFPPNYLLSISCLALELRFIGDRKLTQVLECKFFVALCSVQSVPLPSYLSSSQTE